MRAATASEVQRTSLTLSLRTEAIARSPVQSRRCLRSPSPCSFKKRGTHVILTSAHCIYTNGRSRSDPTACAGLLVIGGNIFIQIRVIGGDKKCFGCSNARLLQMMMLLHVLMRNSVEQQRLPIILQQTRRSTSSTQGSIQRRATVICALYTFLSFHSFQNHAGTDEIIQRTRLASLILAERCMYRWRCTCASS